MIHISDDPSIAGMYDDLCVIDCPKFAAKLRVGDKITFNYGTVEVQVRGFITKESYEKQKEQQANEESSLEEHKLSGALKDKTKSSGDTGD